MITFFNELIRALYRAEHGEDGRTRKKPLLKRNVSLSIAVVSFAPGKKKRAGGTRSRARSRVKRVRAQKTFFVRRSSARVAVAAVVTWSLGDRRVKPVAATFAIVSACAQHVHGASTSPGRTAARYRTRRPHAPPPVPRDSSRRAPARAADGTASCEQQLRLIIAACAERVHDVLSWRRRRRRSVHGRVPCEQRTAPSRDRRLVGSDRRSALDTYKKTTRAGKTATKPYETNVGEPWKLNVADENENRNFYWSYDGVVLIIDAWWHSFGKWVLSDTSWVQVVLWGVIFLWSQCIITIYLFHTFRRPVPVAHCKATGRKNVSDRNMNERNLFPCWNDNETHTDTHLARVYSRKCS